VVILSNINTIYLDAYLENKLITIHSLQTSTYIPYIRCLKIDKLKKIMKK